MQAYLSVAPHVASFPGYLRPLAWHLLRVKARHWDKGVRELAARAVAGLVPLDPAFFAADALAFLLPLCAAAALEARHGAAAAVAELLPALRAAGAALPAAQLAAVGDLVPGVERGKLNRGKGGEVMRSALCRLIETTAGAGVPLGPEQQESLLRVALENLRHAAPDIQAAAAAALAAFAQQYLCGGGGAQAQAQAQDAALVDEGRQRALVERLLGDLQTSGSAAARRGAALALGCLPAGMLAGQQGWAVAAALAGATRVEDDPSARDAETRVNAATALAQVALRLHAPGGAAAAAAPPGHDAEALLARLEGGVIEPLLRAMDDYSTDNRGDVGSWVREAAMVGTVDVLCMLGAAGAARLPAAAAHRALLALLRQSVERIARAREVAGAQLLRLAPLAAAAAAGGDGGTAAAAAAAAVAGRRPEEFGNLEALPAVAGLLSCPPLQEAILEGLVFSVGGLDAQLAEAAAAAAAAALRPLGPAELAAVGEALLAVWARHARSPRLATPLLVAADALLAQTELREVAAADAGFGRRLLAASAAEAAGCADVARLHAAAAVLCQLAGGAAGEVRAPALAAALGLLGSRYPKVRRYAAEQLYTMLLAWEGPEEEGVDVDVDVAVDVDAAMELLSETAWDGAAEVVRPARLAVCASLGVVAAAGGGGEAAGGGGAAAAAVAQAARDENASYGALISREQRGL